MTLCSLQEVLAVCEILTWPTDLSVHLKLTSQSLPVSVLKDLEKLDVYAKGISHPNRPTLQQDYTTDVAATLPPETEFTLELPREVDKSVVAKNLADLLSISSTTWNLPKTYLLVAEGQPPETFCFTDEASLTKAPSSVKNYHAVLDFWALLEKQADHVTETHELIFFRLRRTAIEPGFAASDLSDELTKLLEKIAEFIRDADLQETRSEIFRSVLSEFLRDQTAPGAFGYLLRASKAFALRLSEGLAIYLADNSPEKLSEQAVAKHFELAEKLERVIGGMEAKSLTIPVAVLFAVKEIKAGEGWVTLNLIILVSTLLYSVAMLVAYFSQREMLGLLKKTIDTAKEDLRNQGLSKDDPVLAESFKNLDNRLQNTSRASRIMAFLSTGPLLAAIYVAFLAAPPSKPDKSLPDMRLIPAATSVHSPADRKIRGTL